MDTYGIKNNLSITEGDAVSADVRKLISSPMYFVRGWSCCSILGCLP